MKDLKILSHKADPWALIQRIKGSRQQFNILFPQEVMSYNEIMATRLQYIAEACELCPR